MTPPLAVATRGTLLSRSSPAAALELGLRLLPRPEQPPAAGHQSLWGELEPQGLALEKGPTVLPGWQLVSWGWECWGLLRWSVLLHGEPGQRSAPVQGDAGWLTGRAASSGREDSEETELCSTQ